MAKQTGREFGASINMRTVTGFTMWFSLALKTLSALNYTSTQLLILLHQPLYNDGLTCQQDDNP